MSIRDFNFAIDPTFDPARMPKGSRKDLNACEVTMMMPFSVQCMTCSAFIYKGKKLNSRKEDVLGKTYMGIRLYRFTMKCSTCSAKFCIQTDPEHMDYAVEHGVVRNFEPWRQNEAKVQAALTKRAEEEKYDAVRALENRTLDSKRQMDQLDALEELKAMRAQQAALTADDLLELLAQRDRDLGGRDAAGSGDAGGAAGGGAAGAAAAAATEAEDAAAAREVFQQRRVAAAAASAGVKRLRQDDASDALPLGADAGLLASSGRSLPSALGAPAAPSHRQLPLFRSPGAAMAGVMAAGVSRAAALGGAPRPLAVAAVAASVPACGSAAPVESSAGARSGGTAPVASIEQPRVASAPRRGLVADYDEDSASGEDQSGQ